MFAICFLHAFLKNILRYKKFVSREKLDNMLMIILFCFVNPLTSYYRLGIYKDMVLLYSLLAFYLHVLKFVIFVHSCILYSDQLLLFHFYAIDVPLSNTFLCQGKAELKF